MLEIMFLIVGITSMKINHFIHIPFNNRVIILYSLYVSKNSSIRDTIPKNVRTNVRNMVCN